MFRSELVLLSRYCLNAVGSDLAITIGVFQLMRSDTSRAFFALGEYLLKPAGGGLVTQRPTVPGERSNPESELTVRNQCTIAHRHSTYPEAIVTKAV